MIDMKKATATQLKNHLGQYMKYVRAGVSIVVTDRDEPIAKLVPYDPGKEPLIVRPRDRASPCLGALKVQSISFRGTNTLSLLEEDRARR